MKRRLLSVLLAVVMVLGTVVPALQYLPSAFSVYAASAVPSTGNSIILADSFGALKYALKYAEAGSTIVLDDDFMVDSVDMEVEVGAKGMLTLDLNGMYFHAENNLSDAFIRLTNSTQLYIVDSSGGTGYLGVSIGNVENASIISLENKDAELHIYGASMGIYGGTGITGNQGNAIIKLSQFKSFTAYGLTAQASAPYSNAISFEPVSENAFASSTVYLPDATIRAHGFCITFTMNPEFDDFFMKDSFASFEISMKDFGSYTGGSGYIFDTNGICDVTLADILPKDSLILRTSDDSLVAGTTALYDIDCDVKSVIDRDKNGSFTSADACEYAGADHIKKGNYRELLLTHEVHFRQCTKCTEIDTFKHITSDTDYTAPGKDTVGRSAGTHCLTAQHYDTSAPIPAENHIADTKEIIYISTEDEFVKAMYKSEADITLCLMNDLFFDMDAYHGLEFVPRATGDLTIDLNGRNIYAESSKIVSLFNLYAFNPEKGAIRLHIVNSETDSTSQIVFRSVINTASVFTLAHPAAGLYIYPGVRIVSNLLEFNDYVMAENYYADTIKLSKFNELEIYGAEIVNNTPKGNCIVFDHWSGSDAFEDSSVVLNSCVLRSIDSNIDFISIPTGAVSFDAQDTYFAKAIDNDVSRFSATGDIKVFDILGAGNSLYCNFDFSKFIKASALIKNLAAENEIIVSQGMADRCEDHSTREILIDGRFHYLKCDTCGKITERIEHERIVPDDPGSCEQNIYREYNCDCGLLGAVEFTGHDLKYVAATKTDCEVDGYLEYYECRDCGALFDSPYGGTERELSDFFVPAGEHNCVILTEIIEPDCDDYARRVWICDKDYCDYEKTVYRNDIYPTGHKLTMGILKTVLHERLEPTCTSKGYSGQYYTCPLEDGCGGIYRDALLEEEITEDEFDLPALGHDFSDGFEYIFDATCVDDTVTRRICKRCSCVEFDVTETDGHFFDEGVYIYQSCEDFNLKEYTCIYCDSKKYEKSYPVTGHVYDDIEVITPPDCVSAGKTKISCSNPWCGDFYYDYPPALGGHILEKQDEVPAKCDTDGVKEHYKCTRDGCTALFFDEAGTQAVHNPALLKIPMTKCQTTLKLVAGQENSCTEDGWFAHKKCTACGKTYMPDGVTEFDPFEFMEARGHSLSLRNAKPATCTASGTIAYYECAGQFGCGAKFLDAAGTQPVTDITDPAKAHKLYAVAEVAPSCTERGYKAHYRCELGCGLYFSDDKGTVAVDPDSLFIPYAHTPGEWELTKNPTPDAPGVETLKCSVCKAPISTRNVQYTPPEYILGDIDDNGKVEVADARLALRFAVNLEMLDALQQKAGDADRSGAIEVADARLILRAAVGLETLE
ncbi:MAG: dockerin type I repeat-containing protein [Clostridia bacterium]|nr:dockerin type I repeat-containing protein [Clostridia bacterium]